MRAIEIAPGLALACLIFVLPVALRSLRAVGVAAVTFLAVLAVAWFWWAMALTSPYDRAAAALGLACGAAVLGGGLIVRALVLWRGWSGWASEGLGLIGVVLIGLWVFDGF